MYESNPLLFCQRGTVYVECSAKRRFCCYQIFIAILTEGDLYRNLISPEDHKYNHNAAFRFCGKNFCPLALLCLVLAVTCCI